MLVQIWLGGGLTCLYSFLFIMHPSSTAPKSHHAFLELFVYQTMPENIDAMGQTPQLEADKMEQFNLPVMKGCDFIRADGSLKPNGYRIPGWICCMHCRPSWNIKKYRKTEFFMPRVKSSCSSFTSIDEDKLDIINANTLSCKQVMWQWGTVYFNTIFS